MSSPVLEPRKPTREDIGLGTSKRPTWTIVEDDIAVDSTPTNIVYDTSRSRFTIWDIVNKGSNDLALEVWATLRYGVADLPPTFGPLAWTRIHTATVAPNGHDTQTLTDSYAFIMARMTSADGTTADTVVRTGE